MLSRVSQYPQAHNHSKKEELMEELAEEEEEEEAKQVNPLELFLKLVGLVLDVIL